MRVKLAILISTLSLVACGSNPPKTQEVLVTKVKTVAKYPPETLLKDCPVAKPPDPKTYAKKSFKAKEAALVEFAAQQTVNVGSCNKDKAALRQWKAEQLKLEQELKDKE